MTGRLTGKRCVVLGGTRGIGRGICRDFVPEGAFVVTGRDESEAIVDLLAGRTVGKCLVTTPKSRAKTSCKRT